MAFQTLVRTFLAPALLASVSLAALPAHGDGDAAAAAPAKKVVNLNTASADEIARLPRVGRKLAESIVAHRAKNGAFKRAEDLMEVKGVGEKKFSSLKAYLTVSGPTTLTEKVATASRGKSGGKRAKEAGL